MKKIFLLAFLAITAGLLIYAKSAQKEKKPSKPNILLIYVDDLGYGDVGAYGAVDVKTPNVDKLASQGIKFTDAHTSAATCTPSRYSLLTGSYAFRNNARVLDGDAPLLIQPGSGTLPGMLKKEGYNTAVVGKWHLGLGDGNTDWNGKITPGPLEVGFDYSYIVPATPDRVPCVLVENHHVVNLDPDDPIQISYKHKVGDDPTGLSNPELLKYPADNQHAKTIVNDVSRIGWMSGGYAARWKDENIPYLMLHKARNFIRENKDHPFFLYYAFTEIHVPRMPSIQFTGKSQLGPRGDVIKQMDFITGQLVKYLDDMGIRDNTLIIFSSDNGPVLNDGYDDQSVTLNGDHKPGGPFTGGKYSAYEAGTRVPTIVNWPSVVKSGISDALISQVDLYASIANLVGHKLDGNAAPDSKNVLDALLGKSKEGRQTMIEESITLSLRDGNWKYIRPSNKNHSWVENTKGIQSGILTDPQLYDLSKDKAEHHNVAEEHINMVEQFKSQLKEIEGSKGTNTK